MQIYKRITLAFLLVGSLSWAGCGDDDGGNGNVNTTPITLDPTEFTYALQESTGALPVWTTPCTHKVLTNERAPEDQRSGLRLSAARNEFEPVQVILGPASGSVTVEVAPFPNLGAGQRVELAEATFESGWAEHLQPLSSGGAVSLQGDRGVPVWLTVYVPPGAPAGEHTTTLTLTHDDAPIAVPVTLYVFDFDLPAETHFATQVNVSVAGLIPDGGDTEDAKDLLWEHRLTPKSVTWPSGFNWSITWDNASSTNTCEILWDEPDEGEQYSIGSLAPKYILGQGWNGTGFPNAMIFQFVDNSTPRPGTFCGLDRGDHYGSPGYNNEWTQFLGALDTYLVDNGLSEKAYYYVQNEPQDEADHQLAAYLCELTRSAAPNLRIAVSEEPKPEIAEDPDHPCGYDIWIAHIRAYQQDYAWQRQQDHGEAVWLYSLDHDPDPYFNPTRVDVQGLHQRIIPWVSWHYRATGWAYYDFGRFFDGPLPTIRAELFREGIEDYEYLYLANGGHPRVYVDEALDPTVDSAASSLTSWTKNPDALMALRHELGLYIEGSRPDLPVLQIESSARPRGEYYLNFQDPGGSPAADPLVVDGKTYLKVGWVAYNEDDHYGWYGEFVGDPGITLYGYDDVGGYSEAQKSYVYDDYGRDNLFEFALENGRYDVTIGVGRPQRGYPDDPHNATVEGQVAVDDEVTTDAAPTIERTVTVDLVDGSLSIEVGGRSQSSGTWAYTFLAYVDIVPVD
ncbi:MAG: glycoside hydrolase domain-containing protein [bacterium]